MLQSLRCSLAIVLALSVFAGAQTNPSEQLYVGTSGANTEYPARVFHLDLAADPPSLLGDLVHLGDTAKTSAGQLAMLPNGNLLVAISGENVIKQFDPAGKPLHDFASMPDAWGVAVRPSDGHVFVSGSGNTPEFREYGADGKLLHHLTGEGTLVGRALHLGVNPDSGNLFVSRYGSGQVQEYKITGANMQLVHTLNLPKTEANTFTFVGGVAFRANGNLLIARFGTANKGTDKGDVREYKLSSGAWTEAAAYTSPDLFGCTDVAVDSKDRIYVASYMNRQVVGFSADGKESKLVVTMAQGVYDPWSIEVTPKAAIPADKAKP